MMERAWRTDDGFAQEAPTLNPDHPEFPAYARLSPMDQVVFLRRLIPRAVAAFRNQVESNHQE